MADNKKSFILYTDLIETVKKLPRDIRGDLFTVILEYVNDLNPIIENNLVLEIAFEPVKQQLKRDLIKYDKFRQSQSQNGKQGGRPKKAKPKKEKPKKPSLLDESQKSLSVSVTDTVSAIVTANENEIQSKEEIVEQVPPIPVTPAVILPPDPPKKKEETKDFLACVDFWLKEFHPDWTFGSVHGKAMKSIIKKLQLILKDTANVPDSFRFICQNLPEWFKDKDLQVIDSKFNEIITEIKKISNGQVGKDGKSVSQYHS